MASELTHPAPADVPSSTGAVRWFEDLGSADAPAVGGKAANLGVLARGGFPVPPGFALPASTYLDAVEQAGIRDRLADEGPGDPAAARELITRAGLPDELRDEVVEAYHALGPRVAVAVRSSAPAEDAADNSFAGVHESIIDVTGDDELIDAVVACWTSLWTDRAIAYRAERGYEDEPTLAVVVQAMVAADRSGVMFTADPRTGDRQRLVVEAAFGLGEVLVGGQVEPDVYVLDKTTLRPLSIHGGHQEREILAGPHGEREVDIVAGDQGRRVLDDDELRAVGQIGVRIEDLYGRPQDIEFSFHDDRLWVLQSRPITTLGAPSDQAGDGDGATGSDAAASGTGRQRVLVEGLGAGPGVATGRARVLTSPADSASLQDGEVLVAAMTDPDWLPALRRAAAVVTDGGGVTCHAAIVGRELGRPVVVATRTATTVLTDGQLVTVDGSHGLVLEGAPPAEPTTAGAVAAAPAVTAAPAAEVTATEIYVNLAVPDQAERVAALPVDGVGLLRAEFLVGEALDGRHPNLVVREGRRQEYVEGMADGVRRIARAFAPRPVVYRALDLRSNELRALEGGDDEPEERNPMIGYRGCFRYVRDPDLFALDLDVVATVRETDPNLHLMIPFVRTRWELAACLDLLDGHRLGRDRGLKRWIMAEVPSVAYWLPAYARPGHRRRVHRHQRPHPARPRRRPGLGGLQRPVRPARPRRPRRGRPDHRAGSARRADHLALRPGRVRPRRAGHPPGGRRHHLGLGEPRRGGGHPADGGQGRTPAAARPGPLMDVGPWPTGRATARVVA